MHYSVIPCCLDDGEMQHNIYTVYLHDISFLDSLLIILRFISWLLFTLQNISIFSDGHIPVNPDLITSIPLYRTKSYLTIIYNVIGDLLELQNISFHLLFVKNFTTIAKMSIGHNAPAINRHIFESLSVGKAGHQGEWVLACFGPKEPCGALPFCCTPAIAALPLT